MCLCTHSLPRYPDRGHAAEYNYRNPTSIVVIGPGDYFSFAWKPLEHQIFFGRPSPKLTLKLLREGGSASLTNSILNRHRVAEECHSFLCAIVSSLPVSITAAATYNPVKTQSNKSIQNCLPAQPHDTLISTVVRCRMWIPRYAVCIGDIRRKRWW